MVCTGGGPGFMEAANKGASRVKGARNMGMGTTLPFEQGGSRTNVDVIVVVEIVARLW